MAIAPTYPGVYIEELSSGVHTISGVATSIAAFVGYTLKGPVNQAVRIANFSDYERSFGGLNRDAEVGFAVQQFFLNGGTDAYVVRTAKGAAAASVALRWGTAAGNEALVIRAANEGEWGNSLRVDVDYATSDPDNTFNLTVTQFGRQGDAIIALGSPVAYRNLSMNSRSASYAPAVINADPKLVRVERPAALVFANNRRGLSLGGKLPNPAALGLAAADRVLKGVLDGSRAFTLVLQATPATADALVAGLNAAIAAEALAPRLAAERADANATTDPAGTHIVLRSLDAGTPDSAAEFSSVVIEPTSLAQKILLGRANGGREFHGARSRRPLANGTTGGDLWDTLGTNAAGNLQAVVNDRRTGAAVFTSAGPVVLAPVAIGPLAAPALEAAIRGMDPLLANATVEWAGTALRVAPNTTLPDATITLSDAAATALRLTGAAGAVVNVQDYCVGTGTTFVGQAGAVAGDSGDPPEAAELIGNEAAKEGMYALLDVDLFNLLCIPRTTMLSPPEALAVLADAKKLCGDRRAFLIIDPDPTKTLDTIAPWVESVGADRNAAVFFPSIRAADPTEQFRIRPMPPSGAIAGVMARTDTERGVWKAPAGTEATIRGAQGLASTLTDAENGRLNPRGVNCLRTLPGYGTVVWGSRTMVGSDAQASEWKYLPVRRTALFLEESLFRGTHWVVFEPNDEPLWSQIRLNLGAFMHTLFRKGAFQGTTPKEAYFVKCDSETTTQNDINLGVVNIVVGFAPLKPAEFVIVQIQQIAGDIAT